MLAKFMFPMIIFFPTLRIGPYLFRAKKFLTQFKAIEKITGNHTRLRENDDFLYGKIQLQRKSRHFLAGILIMCE